MCLENRHLSPQSGRLMGRDVCLRDHSLIYRCVSNKCKCFKTFLFAPNFYLAILANLISVKKYGKIVTIFIYKHLFWVFTFMAYFEKFMISTSEHKCLWTQRASNKKLLCLFFYGAIYLHREARAQLGKFERGARRFICNRKDGVRQK